MRNEEFWSYSANLQFLILNSSLSEAYYQSVAGFMSSACTSSM